MTHKQENTAGRSACGVLRFAQQIRFEEGLAPSSSPAAQKIQICSDTTAHTDMCFRLVSPGCALTIPRCRCSAPRRRARCRCRRDTAPRRRRCSYAGDGEAEPHQRGHREHEPRTALHLQRATAVFAATRALLSTSWMLLSRLSPPVSSATRASRNGVVSLPWMPCSWLSASA